MITKEFIGIDKDFWEREKSPHLDIKSLKDLISLAKKLESDKEISKDNPKTIKKNKETEEMLEVLLSMYAAQRVAISIEGRILPKLERLGKKFLIGTRHYLLENKV